MACSSEVTRVAWQPDQVTNFAIVSLFAVILTGWRTSMSDKNIDNITLSGIMPRLAL
jgi:hypothetical protein